MSSDCAHRQRTTADWRWSVGQPATSMFSGVQATSEAWTAFLFYVVFEHSRQCRIKTKGRGSPPSFPFIVISEQPRQSRRLRSQRWRAIPERSRRPRIVTVREWRAIPERSRMQKLVTVRACERSRSGPDGSKSRNVFSKKRSLGAVPEQSRV